MGWSLLAGLWAAAASGQVVMPTSLVGRYELTMYAGSPASPIRDGVSVLLELSQDGVLCVDGIHFTDPFLRTEVPGSIAWASSILGLQFSTNPGENFSLDVGSDKGVFYGKLAGTRLSTTTTACGKTPFTASVEDFFRFAEATYTDLFPASPFIFTQSDPTSAYRYYPATATYLSVSDTGIVQASGGKFGATPRSLGTLASIWANPDQHDFREYLTDVQPTATLGSYYAGTYTLSLTDTQPFSPVPDGTTLTFVVTDSLQLCVGETVLSPTLEQPPSIGQDTPTSRDIPLVWKNPLVGYYYRMVLVPDEEKFERRGEGRFDFVSSSGFSYGSFAGERTSLGTDCADYMMDQLDLAQVELLFDLFEQRYAEVFPGGPQTYNQQVNGSVVREYLQSGVTVRILNEEVLARGGVFGSAEVRLGKLANLIAAMRGQSISYSIPLALEGTYDVDFIAAGDHVGMPSRTGLQLALYQDGRLCMDGVVFMQPQVDPLNPAIVRWDSSEGGFSLQLDTAALEDNALDLAMVSASGLGLGDVSGIKSSNLPACNGLLFADVDMDDLQTIFDLAEQLMPKQFPASALTYTRMEDAKVLRYYPSTRVLVTVDESGVTVSGGVFGAQGQQVGSVAQVTALLLKELGSQPLPTTANLKVTGMVRTVIGGMSSVSKSLSISRSNAPLPSGQSTAELIPYIQQALGSELSGTSEFVVSNVVSGATALSFDVVINSRVQMQLSSATSSYTLKFNYAIGS